MTMELKDKPSRRKRRIHRRGVVEYSSLEEAMRMPTRWRPGDVVVVSRPDTGGEVQVWMRLATAWARLGLHTLLPDPNTTL